MYRAVKKQANIVKQWKWARQGNILVIGPDLKSLGRTLHNSEDMFFKFVPVGDKHNG